MSYERRGRPASRSVQLREDGGPPRRSVAPGKRTATQDLRPGPGSARAPAQRKPDPAAEAQRREQAELTARWMNVAIRPDLHAPPAQRKSAGEAHGRADASPASGSGRPLPENVQAKMEHAFGADFSNVRVHEGPQAQAIGALAYTQGTDIHFAPGRYDPHSGSGQELLGHELTHVVQQSQGRVQASTQARGVAVNDAPALEHEADQMGARAARGQQVGGGAASAGGAVRGAPVQRKLAYQGKSITEVDAAIALLTQKAKEHGRRIDFEAHREGIATLLEEGTLYELYDGEGDVPRHALSRIILRLNELQGVEPGPYYQPFSVEEILRLVWDEVELQKIDESTYSYRNGGTSKLEQTIAGAQYLKDRDPKDASPALFENRLVKTEGDDGLRQLALEGSPLRFLERERAQTKQIDVSSIPKELQKTATRLATETDILGSAAWRSHRVQSEFIGTVGEYVAQLDVGSLMPTRDEEPREDSEKSVYRQLASVHFIGDCFDSESASTPTYADTDAGPELDLLTIRETKSGPEYVAVGNIKVASSNQAGAARSQNADALKLLESFDQGKRVKLGEGRWALVKRITALDIQQGTTFEIKPPLPRGKNVAEVTIGAEKAPGQYTKRLPYTYREFDQITQYLQHLARQQKTQKEKQ